MWRLRTNRLLRDRNCLHYYYCYQHEVFMLYLKSQIHYLFAFSCNLTWFLYILSLKPFMMNVKLTDHSQIHGFCLSFHLKVYNSTRILYIHTYILVNIFCVYIFIILQIYIIGFTKQFLQQSLNVNDPPITSIALVVLYKAIYFFFFVF